MLVRWVLALLAALLTGFLLGVLVQRYYPLGSLLYRIGLRELLPIARNIPENEPGYVPPDWDVPPAARGRLMLFVLMGQSNMSGRGNLADPLTPPPHPHIFSFDKDYRWRPAQEPLGTTLQDVDWVAIDGGTGVGPGLAFAHALLVTDPSLHIGMIPCARGASTIVEWQADLSQNSLYGACLKRILAASSYGDLAAVLFSQGESDADAPTAHDWAAYFGKLVTDLRRDTGQPDLLVLYTQLGDYRGGRALPGWKVVQSQQTQAAGEREIMIVTEDLALNTEAHFDTASQVQIGRRMAQAFLAAMSKQQ